MTNTLLGIALLVVAAGVVFGGPLVTMAQKLMPRPADPLVWHKHALSVLGEVRSRLKFTDEATLREVEQAIKDDGQVHVWK